jgi:hypothetical protein
MSFAMDVETGKWRPILLQEQGNSRIYHARHAWLNTKSNFWRCQVKETKIERG